MSEIEDATESELLIHAKTEFNKNRHIILKDIPPVTYQEVKEFLGTYGVKNISISKKQRHAIVSLLNGEDAETIIHVQQTCSKLLLGEPVEIDIYPSDNLLCITHLPFNFDNSDLRSIAETYGVLERCFMMPGLKSGKSKGYGFVEFAHNKEMSEEARKSLDGRRFGSCVARCSFVHDSVLSFQDLESRCLFVDHLPATFTNVAEFKRLCNRSAEPIFCQLGLKEKEPLGFGIAEYSCVEDAEATQQEINAEKIDGCMIRVSYCPPGEPGMQVFKRMQDIISQSGRVLKPGLKPNLAQKTAFPEVTNSLMPPPASYKLEQSRRGFQPRMTSSTMNQPRPVPPLLGRGDGPRPYRVKSLLDLPPCGFNRDPGVRPLLPRSMSDGPVRPLLPPQMEGKRRPLLPYPGFVKPQPRQPSEVKPLLEPLSPEEQQFMNLLHMVMEQMETEFKESESQKEESDKESSATVKPNLTSTIIAVARHLYLNLNPGSREIDPDIAQELAERVERQRRKRVTSLLELPVNPPKDEKSDEDSPKEASPEPGQAPGQKKPLLDPNQPLPQSKPAPHIAMNPRYNGPLHAILKGSNFQSLAPKKPSAEDTPQTENQPPRVPRKIVGQGVMESKPAGEASGSSQQMAGLNTQSTASTGYGQQQPSTGYSQNQPSMGYNQNQPSTGYSQNQPSTGSNQNQPSTGYNQNQPSTGYNQNQPSTGYSQTSQSQTPVGYSQNSQSQTSVGYSQNGQTQNAIQQAYPGYNQSAYPQPLMQTDTSQAAKDGPFVVPSQPPPAKRRTYDNQQATNYQQTTSYQQNTNYQQQGGNYPPATHPSENYWNLNTSQSSGDTSSNAQAWADYHAKYRAWYEAHVAAQGLPAPPQPPQTPPQYSQPSTSGPPSSSSTASSGEYNYWTTPQLMPGQQPSAQQQQYYGGNMAQGSEGYQQQGQTNLARSSSLNSLDSAYGSVDHWSGGADTLSVRSSSQASTDGSFMESPTPDQTSTFQSTGQYGGQNQSYAEYMNQLGNAQGQGQGYEESATSTTPRGTKRTYPHLLPSPEASPDGSYVGQHSQGIGGHYADTYSKKRKMNT